MPKLVVTHAVKEVAHWLTFHAERASQLAPFGSDVTDHVAVDGSNTVAVSMVVNDMAAFQAVMATPPPEMAAAMERHGVVPPLNVFVQK